MQHPITNKRRNLKIVPKAFAHFSLKNPPDDGKYFLTESPTIGLASPANGLSLELNVRSFLRHCLNPECLFLNANEGSLLEKAGKGRQLS